MHPEAGPPESCRRCRHTVRGGASADRVLVVDDDIAQRDPEIDIDDRQRGHQRDIDGTRLEQARSEGQTPLTCARIRTIGE